MNFKDVALNNLILKCEVGSRVHGTSIGSDDRDEMGIAIPPPVHAFGLQQFEHYVQRDQPEGVPSQPGDLDLTVYSLRKWLTLTIKGNPNTLIPLFAPYASTSVFTEIWQPWVERRDSVLSKRTANAFTGYLIGQQKQLLQSSTKLFTVSKLGFDTKAAGHAVRLGIQGVELLTEHTLTLPMNSVDADLIKSIRRGEIAFDRVLHLIDMQLVDLVKAAESSSLPDEPDVDSLEQAMIADHFEYWQKGNRSEEVEELTEALRFTAEYCGPNLLPPVEGWSWFDALMKYAPEKVPRTS